MIRIERGHRILAESKFKDRYDCRIQVEFQDGEVNRADHLISPAVGTPDKSRPSRLVKRRRCGSLTRMDRLMVNDRVALPSSGQVAPRARRIIGCPADHQPNLFGDE